MVVRDNFLHCSPASWSFTILFSLNNFAMGKVDWCSLTCDGGIKNTMCDYRPQASIRGCTEITTSTTPQKRKQMLKLHNDHRANLAIGKAAGQKGNWPKAANMRLMTWDNDLEELALRWVQQCKAGHDKCRRTPAFANAGQNWGYEGRGGSEAVHPDWDLIFKAWYDEIHLINDHVKMVDGFEFHPSWAHYTQVVWAETYKLGCAEIHYNKNGMLNTAGVCNYGPQGNYLRRKMYERGEPCTKCPEGTSCTNDSPVLCAAPGDSTEEHLPGPPPGPPPGPSHGSSLSTLPISLAVTLGILIHLLNQ